MRLVKPKKHHFVLASMKDKMQRKPRRADTPNPVKKVVVDSKRLQAALERARQNV